MATREERQPDRLFEGFFVYSIPPAGSLDPKLTYQYPDVCKSVDLEQLKQFCFPYKEEDADAAVSQQEFCFTLTDASGNLLYGFTMQNRPATPASESTCLCLVTQAPWHATMREILRVLNSQRATELVGKMDAAHRLLIELEAQPLLPPGRLLRVGSKETETIIKTHATTISGYGKSLETTVSGNATSSSPPLSSPTSEPAIETAAGKVPPSNCANDTTDATSTMAAIETATATMTMTTTTTAATALNTIANNTSSSSNSSSSSSSSSSGSHSRRKSVEPAYIFATPARAPLLPSTHAPHLATLCATLPPRAILTLFAAVLNERRILVTSARLDLVSAYAHACDLILRPLAWQGVFIPIIPRHLLDYCAAPVPFIVGVHASLFVSIAATSEALEGVVVVDADAGTVTSPYSESDELPDALFTPLKHVLKRHQASALPGTELAGAFAEVVISLTSGYHAELIRGRVKRGDREIANFDADTFATEKPRSYVPLVRALCRTQAWAQFVDVQFRALQRGDTGPLEAYKTIERLVAAEVAARPRATSIRARVRKATSSLRGHGSSEGNFRGNSSLPVSFSPPVHRASTAATASTTSTTSIAAAASTTATTATTTEAEAAAKPAAASGVIIFPSISVEEDISGRPRSRTQGAIIRDSKKAMDEFILDNEGARGGGETIPGGGVVDGTAQQHQQQQRGRSRTVSEGDGDARATALTKSNLLPASNPFSPHSPTPARKNVFLASSPKQAAAAPTR
eukprot:UC1_evm1s9